MPYIKLELQALAKIVPPDFHALVEWVSQLFAPQATTHRLAQLPAHSVIKTITAL